MLNVKKLSHALDQQGVIVPTRIKKRDGSTVPFDPNRIVKAVEGCYRDLDITPRFTAEEIAAFVVAAVAARNSSRPATVEQVQDLVEATLAGMGEFDAARAYMTYRDAHAARRDAVPDEVRAAFAADAEYFPTQLQQFQFYDKYSRFNWDNMRRETWVETVDRDVDHLRWLIATYASHAVEAMEPHLARVHDAMLNHQAMSSMRLLSMAGEPARRDGLALFNCSYMPVDALDAFPEALLISMAGCGVGYSVERQYVDKLPRIARQTGDVTDHWVEDSTQGWADAVRFGLHEWFAGRDVTFHYDLVRPAGSVLRIKGGRASGPEPLKAALNLLRSKVLARQGGVLRPIDAHDMMCAIGGAAVAGGVRRTAMICLFSWDDEEMRTCKDGVKLDQNPVRWNANNSAVWPEGLTQLEVMQQMMAMYEGGRGEPGIFSRSNALASRPARREAAEFGTNPCGEIILRPFGLCNLSIAIARPDDTLSTLLDKVEIAAIIGTIQSLSTHFPGMREEWKRNAEEERLIGVDLLGERDCPLLTGPDADVAMRHLKANVIGANAYIADILGINPAAATTCNKPGGNSSLTFDTPSGIGTRWAPYALRRTRVGASTPLYRVLRAAGVPMTPENGQTVSDATTWVVAWPVKAPEGAKTRKDVSAIEQCEFWLLNKLNWTEHNPSITVTYRPDEMLALTQWVWEHRDLIGGMAFLPADDAGYEQAPWEEITKEKYEAAVESFPSIDWSLLYQYEKTDMTTAAQELACLAGSCEV